MVLIENYARTGPRNWSIAGEKVCLKPLYRGEPAKPKPPEPVACLPPPKPKPKPAPKWQSKTVEVSFTFVIGGYKSYE